MLEDDKQSMIMTLAHFEQTKNSAVLQPRTGHFRGLAGFGAKDLTVEAKDFKCCLRGQGRRRKLHLRHILQKDFSVCVKVLLGNCD